MASFAFHFICIVWYFDLVLMNSESVDLYVSTSGTLNEYCTFSKPCGSLAIALWNIEYGYIHNENVIIYVSGHYSEAFNADIDCNSQIHGNIMIIFDKDYIDSTAQWAPYINICDTLHNDYTLYQIYGEESSLQFHHLIYEHTNALFLDSTLNSIASIHCFDCTFSHLYISPNTSHHFITVHHTSMFIDCLFENITINNVHNLYSVAFIDVSVYLDDALIIMDNCTMNNVNTLHHNTYIMNIEPHIKHYISMNITNVLFFNSYTPYSSRFIYANTDSKFVNSKNKISLHSSSFSGCMNIIYIDQGIFAVNINDVHITTPQYITNQDELYLNTIHIGEHSVSSITNVYFKTLLSCDKDHICEIPIGFVYNAGNCNVSNIIMEGYTNYNDSLHYMEYDMDISKMHYIFSIYNDNEGTIRMDNVSFLNGANYHFLYNLRGTVRIHRFNTIQSDIWNLKPLYLFVNYGYLYINHSNIIGCSAVAFQLYHGSLYIYNSVLSYVPSVIQSMYTVDHVYLESVNISNITMRYSPQYTHSIHIASHDISITNCLFDMHSSDGILQFVTIGALESSALKLQSIQKRIITMDNNQFVYNHGTVFDVNNTSLNGYIQVMDPYSIQLTRNKFMFSGVIDTETDVRIPWIYIDTSMYDHCSASNIFYGNALFIQNGSMISCKYPTITPMMDDMDTCLVSYGTPDRQYTDSTLFVYTNTSIYCITLNESSNIILDSVQFVDFNSIPINIIGTNNSISMFDTLIMNENDSNMFQVPIYCDIKCYEIVDDNKQQLRQLRVICDAYTDSNAFIDIEVLGQRHNVIQAVSSWSPYRIHLTSDAVWPGLYPGGRIVINYTIFDVYDNIVHDYDNDLQIILSCDALDLQHILSISSERDSDLCDICVDGFGFEVPHLTMENVGSVYWIFTSVLNDFLLVNNLNISIVHCPQELIVSNDSRCIDSIYARYVPHRIELRVWIAVVSVSVCLTVLLVVYFVCKTHAQLSLVQEESRLAKYIENPLVVLIGIGIYEYLPDLPMDVDLENLSRLFRYLNYTIMGHETKLQWTEDEVMQFIEESAKEACEYKYDALMVIISCHGSGGHIVTTDMRRISFDRIHRSYSMHYPELRYKPRIFVYDYCCMNTTNGIAESEEIMSSHVAIEDERGASGHPSPDHQLVQIYTESVNIQSKMNQIDGSYVLHEFGKRIIANIDEYSNGNIKCLGQIMDAINHEKAIKIEFNDDTRYLKLIKNEIRKEIGFNDGKLYNENANTYNGEEGDRDGDGGGNIENTAPKISHIAIERVYRSHSHITNPSLIGSDKASTMSATRRDKFIRRSRARKNIKNNAQKQMKTKRRYRIIEMEDIEEDSEENEVELAMDQDEDKHQIVIHREPTEEEKEEEEEHDDDDDDDDDGLNQLIISQNVIEISDTDSSETQTDTVVHKFSPVGLRESDSTQL